MENKKKRHSVFNIFDIVVIIIVVVLAVVLVVYTSSGSSDTEDGGSGSGTGTVTYTIELTGMINDSADLINVGDELVDKIKKYDIGTVRDVTVKNSVKQTQNYEEGVMVDTELQTTTTATVVVEAECTETDTEITVAGGYIIRVGLSVSVKGPGYYGTGYIIAVDRGD